MMPVVDVDLEAARLLTAFNQQPSGSPTGDATSSPAHKHLFVALGRQPSISLQFDRQSNMSRPPTPGFGYKAFQSAGPDTVLETKPQSNLFQPTNSASPDGSQQRSGLHSRDNWETTSLSGKHRPSQANSVQAPPRNRSSKLIQNHTDDLHPILKLGWRPLCEVHCNGLVGEFLGGHDRDLYIKCTGGDFSNLPPIDYSQGGCVMTCSQFEKVAGRELSKKWKESIHVVGEGEGSKATLVSWLKRRAEQDYGESVVGKHVWVCWCADSDYYLGHIISYSRENGKHKVQYSDRFMEELHLPVELLWMGEEKPVGTLVKQTEFVPRQPLALPQAGSPEESCGTAARQAPKQNAAAVTTHGASVAVKGIRPHSALYHQGSGISVTSMFDESSAKKECSKLEKRFKLKMKEEELQRLRRARQNSEEEEFQPKQKPLTRRKSRAFTDEDILEQNSISEGSDSPTLTPPKKLRTGLQESLRHPQHQTLPAFKPPTLEAVNRLQHQSSVSSLGQNQKKTSPLPPKNCSVSVFPGRSDRLTPPPASGFDETNVRVISRWMNSLVLQLDDSLALKMKELYPIADGGPEVKVSASARFQTVLVYARRTNCIHGYYEAMLCRYEHFKHDARLLQRKMEEFVLAALVEDTLQRERELVLLAQERKVPDEADLKEQFGDP